MYVYPETFDSQYIRTYIVLLQTTYYYYFFFNYIILYYIRKVSRLFFQFFFYLYYIQISFKKYICIYFSRIHANRLARE